MVNTEKMVTAVVVLGIAAIVIGTLLPIATGALADDQVTTLTQDNQTTTEVKPGLDSTVDDVNTSASPNQSTITLDLDGTTEQNTVDEGSVVTYTIDGYDIDVGLESADTSTSPDQITSNYTYDQAVGYSGGASSLWNILDLAVILGAFLFIVGLAMAYMNRV